MSETDFTPLELVHLEVDWKLLTLRDEMLNVEEWSEDLAACYVRAAYMWGVMDTIGHTRPQGALLRRYIATAKEDRKDRE